jgi:hypothetical protein
VQPAPPTSWSGRPAHASHYLAGRHKSGRNVGLKPAKTETFSDFPDVLAVIRRLAAERGPRSAKGLLGGILPPLNSGVERYGGPTFSSPSTVHLSSCMGDKEPPPLKGLLVCFGDLRFELRTVKFLSCLMKCARDGPAT